MSPAATFASVVLPIPFGPTSDTTSPRRSESDSSTSTGGPPGYAYETSLQPNDLVPCVADGAYAGASGSVHAEGTSFAIRPSRKKTIRSANASGSSGRCSATTTAHPCAARVFEESLGGVPIELGRRLVEKQQLRLERERRRETDPLQLAARELGNATLREVLARRLQPAPRARAARSRPAGVPRFSSPNDTSASTRVSTTWSSGSWNSVATVPASSAGRVRSRVAAADLDASAETTAVEVRNEPCERPQERRLARPRRAEQRDELARLDLERNVCERRPAGPRIGEPEFSTVARATAPRRRRSAAPPPRQLVEHASTAASAARVRPGRPKPRASIASARFSPRSSDPASERREQPRASPAPSTSTPRPRNASTSPTASRSSVGTSRVASATASADRRSADGGAEQRVVVEQQRVDGGRETDRREAQRLHCRAGELLPRDRRARRAPARSARARTGASPFLRATATARTPCRPRRRRRRDSRRRRAARAGMERATATAIAPTHPDGSVERARPRECREQRSGRHRAHGATSYRNRNADGIER